MDLTFDNEIQIDPIAHNLHLCPISKYIKSFIWMIIWLFECFSGQWQWQCVLAEHSTSLQLLHRVTQKGVKAPWTQKLHCLPVDSQCKKKSLQFAVLDRKSNIIDFGQWRKFAKKAWCIMFWSVCSTCSKIRFVLHKLSSWIWSNCIEWRSELIIYLI